MHGNFSLNDLPGAGRVDVLCRCINAAFLLSHGIRENVELYVVIRDQVTVRLDGARLKRVNPDERSTAGLLKKALTKASLLEKGEERETTPGIHVSKQGLEDVLMHVSQDSTVFQLHENGTPITETTLPENAAFILSDHNNFTPEENQVIEKYAEKAVSIGPNVLHANHCITVVHNAFDTQQV